jgi:chromosome partitioning protein
MEHVMRIVAFYSPKGGVGKTASAVNIAYLANAGRCSTLLWDLDPQGAASFYLSGASRNKGRKISKLLDGRLPIADFVEENVYPNLDLLPSHTSFRNFDIKLEDDDRNNPLKAILGPLSEDTSLVVLDCPPGQRTRNSASKSCGPFSPWWTGARSFTGNWRKRTLNFSTSPRRR